MALELPNDAERDYLKAFDAVAIIVTQSPIMVRATHDPRRTWSALASSYPVIDIVEVYWTSPAKIGRRVIAAAKNPSALPSAASACGVVLTPNTVALSRAREALKRMDVLLQEAKARGDLRSFNRAYRQARLAGIARHPYQAMMGKLRKLVLGHAAGLVFNDPSLDRVVFERLFHEIVRNSE